jgi:hypothetical protein
MGGGDKGHTDLTEGRDSAYFPGFQQADVLHIPLDQEAVHQATGKTYTESHSEKRDEEGGC